MKAERIRVDSSDDVWAERIRLIRLCQTDLAGLSSDDVWTERIRLIRLCQTDLADLGGRTDSIDVGGRTDSTMSRW